MEKSSQEESLSVAKSGGRNLAAHLPFVCTFYFTLYPDGVF